MVEIHFSSLATCASNQVAINVSPNTNFSVRLGQAADQFGLFRVNKLKFRLLPYSGMLGDGSLAWIAGVTDTKPSTNISNLECMHSVPMATNQSVPSRWINVPTSDLRGYQPWYKTIPGSPDTAQEIPGVLNFCSANAAGVLSFEWYAQIELKDPIATGSTPEEVMLSRRLAEIRAKRVLDRERNKLLLTLSPTASVKQ